MFIENIRLISIILANIHVYNMNKYSEMGRLLGKYTWILLLLSPVTVTTFAVMWLDSDTSSYRIYTNPSITPANHRHQFSSLVLPIKNCRKLHCLSIHERQLYPSLVLLSFKKLLKLLQLYIQSLSQDIPKSKDLDWSVTIKVRPDTHV